MDNAKHTSQVSSYEKLTPDKVLKSPPMGWNSWDCFGASVTEEEVRANALYMHQHLKEYGWEYVVVDIQWYEPTADGWFYHDFYPLTLDAYGRPQPDAGRFPSAANGAGFKPLADFVHGLGLKFGIHIMRGVPRQAAHQNLPIWRGGGLTCRDAAAQASICKWNTDMYGADPARNAAAAWYDAQYAQYAEWGVDFVKVDDIAWNFIAEDQYPEAEVALISQAISKSGRPIVLSLSPGPAVFEKREHLKQHAHMWRMTDDFWDKWELLLTDITRCHEWADVVSPGNWPDADMLPLGWLRDRQGRGEMTKFTRDEQRLVMNLWSFFRSPLMMGGHLPKNDDWTLSLLTNRELLSFNQTGGWPKELAYKPDGLIAWTQVDDEGKACGLLLINPVDEALSVELHLNEEPWRVFGASEIVLKDLWAVTEDLTWTSAQSIKLDIGAHASLCFKTE